MTDKKDEDLEVSLNDMGFINAVKGKTKAKNFKNQIKELKGVFNDGERRRAINNEILVW